MEWPLWTAFWDLATERPVGMGPGPIPVSVIRAAARDFGMDAKPFTAIMRAMDQAYLAHANGETKTFSRDMIKR